MDDPFKVLRKVGKMAYKLEFSETLKIHEVFQISLLKSYKIFIKIQPLPLPILEDDKLLFNVEQVLTYDVRGICTRPRNFYFIKWLGYGLEYNFSEQKKIELKNAQRILGYCGTFT